MFAFVLRVDHPAQDLYEMRRSSSTLFKVFIQFALLNGYITVESLSPILQNTYPR